MGFFFLSAPGSAPVWLHRVNLLSDRRAVRIDLAVFVKHGETWEKYHCRLQKKLKDLAHTETNSFSIIFGEKLFSAIGAGGKMMFLSQGQQHLECGGDEEET